MPGSNPSILNLGTTTAWSRALMLKSNATGGLAHLGLPWYNTTDYSNDLDSLLDTVGLAGSYVVNVDAACTISASKTAGAGIHFVFAPGAQITVNTGVTLTINSPEHIKGQARQKLFTLSGTGVVAFTNGGVVFPGWWGAVGDGSTDDSAEIQAALDAMEAAGGGVVHLPGANYEIGSTTLVLDADSVWLRGEGRSKTQIQYNGTGAAISVGTSGGTARNYCGVEGLYLVKEGTAREAGSLGIVQYSGQSLCLRDLWISSFETGIFLDGDGDGGGMAYIVGVNMDFVRISAPKIGVLMDNAITATFSRGLHIVGPGKTSAGSIGISQTGPVGGGNDFFQTSIETIETGVKVSTYRQNFFGLRLESCTTGIDWNGAGADNCIFLGVSGYSNTTDVAATPSGANGNVVQLNGISYLPNDTSGGGVERMWSNGFADRISRYYDPTNDKLIFRKVGVASIMELKYSNLMAYFYSAIQAGSSGTQRGALVLTHGSGGNTPGYMVLNSPNGTPYYMFVEDDKTLKLHTTVPTQNSDGSVVGAQT